MVHPGTRPLSGAVALVAAGALLTCGILLVGGTSRQPGSSLYVLLIGNAAIACGVPMFGVFAAHLGRSRSKADRSLSDRGAWWLVCIWSAAYVFIYASYSLLPNSLDAAWIVLGKSFAPIAAVYCAGHAAVSKESASQRVLSVLPLALLLVLAGTMQTNGGSYVVVGLVVACFAASLTAARKLAHRCSPSSTIARLAAANTVLLVAVLLIADPAPPSAVGEVIVRGIGLGAVAILVQQLGLWGLRVTPAFLSVPCSASAVPLSFLIQEGFNAGFTHGAASRVVAWAYLVSVAAFILWSRSRPTIEPAVVSVIRNADDKLIGAIRVLRREVYAVAAVNFAQHDVIERTIVDELDHDAIHVIVETNGVLVAAGRLTIHSTQLRCPIEHAGTILPPGTWPLGVVSRLGVSPRHAGKGYGSRVIGLLLVIATQEGVAGLSGYSTSSVGRHICQSVGMAVFQQLSFDPSRISFGEARTLLYKPLSGRHPSGRN